MKKTVIWVTDEGGHWINMGIPMYVAIDRKPENGCKIQNTACGQSGVMIRLKLVKTAQEEASNNQEEPSSAPWRTSSQRTSDALGEFGSDRLCQLVF
jgi:hypothetical protein